MKTFLAGDGQRPTRNLSGSYGYLMPIAPTKQRFGDTCVFTCEVDVFTMQINA